MKRLPITVYQFITNIVIRFLNHTERIWTIMNLAIKRLRNRHAVGQSLTTWSRDMTSFIMASRAIDQNEAGASHWHWLITSTYISYIKCYRMSNINLTENQNCPDLHFCQMFLQNRHRFVHYAKHHLTRHQLPTSLGFPNAGRFVLSIYSILHDLQGWPCPPGEE